MADPDQYYTPEPIASRLANAITLTTVQGVVDSNCGSGRLLNAAAERFPRARCVGIDANGFVLSRLAGRRPDWHLFVGDSLDRISWQALRWFTIDAAVLNPPFSMGPTKGLVTEFGNTALKVSTSMAHVLSVIRNVAPMEIAAIVPESWMYSDLDSDARSALALSYKCEILESLSRNTFPGAKANSLMIRLQRRRRSSHPASAESPSVAARFRLIRGGLPVFESRDRRGGTPYLHSTDLSTFASLNTLRKVSPLSRGLVSGEAILFPRVGRPTIQSVRLVNLQSEVQLSDCVMAITAARTSDLVALHKRILNGWSGFQGLFTGTGARFTTVSKVTSWMGGA
jgi:predicted RNA methylase